MIRMSRFIFCALALSGVMAHAQWYTLHNGSLSVGATGQFTSPIQDFNGRTGVYQVPFRSGITTYPTTLSGQRQYATISTGFLTSLQWHPVAWAGVEVNYGFTHYQERFSFNSSAAGGATQVVQVPTDWHEATAAYQFHVKRLPFQPFVNIGGGAIDFAPSVASNQWRGAGLLEAGWDMPVKHSKFGFRIEGRSLFYRAPNFNTTAISTRHWRVTVEPSASVYYRF